MLLDQLLAYGKHFGESVWSTALLVFFGTLLLLHVKNLWSSRGHSRSAEDLSMVGDITEDELSKYNGRDPFSPLLFAVKGIIYDVSKGSDFYGPGCPPGGGYAVFAGKEVARALGLMSLKAEDCNARLDDLSEKQLKVLEDWEAKFNTKYPIVGQVVAPKELTLDDLRSFDGTDSSKPIYLAIKGAIFDVTKGRQFYGPDGVYPFAGRECARAFALLSTETSDCTADLSGLHVMELDNLRGWEEKFYSKYKVVGKVVAS